MHFIHFCVRCVLFPACFQDSQRGLAALLFGDVIAQIRVQASTRIPCLHITSGFWLRSEKLSCYVYTA